MNGHLSAPETTRWRWRWLAFWHVLAAVVVASWLIGPTRVAWDWADHLTAVWLNSMLGWGQWSQRLWAYAGTRLFDLLAAVLMTSLLLCYVFCCSGYKQLGRRIGEAGFIGIGLVLTIGFFREVIFTDWFIDIRRDSPTLAMEAGALLRLSELTPDIKVKDASAVCFPGDHAVVVGTFVGLFWFFAGWRFGVAAAAMGVFFILPRLVAGAHWLTDVIVGGFVIAAVSCAWVLCTPLHLYAIRVIEVSAHATGNLIDHVLGRDPSRVAGRSAARSDG